MKNYFSLSLRWMLIFSLTLVPTTNVKAAEIFIPVMPKPGTMVNLSSTFNPAHLKGMTVHPENALQFDFLMDKGQDVLNEEVKKEEYTKIIKYFLASLTIPDKDQWVNLSPYESGRIIENNFGKTEMGRDLLAQDYLLKQITSSMMYPESGLGKNFWDKVYEKAYKELGNTNIPVNTINKVWIMPDEAVVYESNNSAIILKSRLKVMLEEDYLAVSKNNIAVNVPVADKAKSNTSQVIRDIILPELEKEVNEGKNFAQLRQIVSAMVLATWYKQALKESILGKVYADQAKVNGVNQDPKANDMIYQQYLAAFKKGVYNYIKEDEDKYTNQIIPRKYFSGGFVRQATSDSPTAGVRVLNASSFKDAAMAARYTAANLAYNNEDFRSSNYETLTTAFKVANESDFGDLEGDFQSSTIPGQLREDGTVSDDVVEVKSTTSSNTPVFSLDKLAVERGVNRIKFLYTSRLEGFIDVKTGEFLTVSNGNIARATVSKELIPVKIFNDGKKLEVQRAVDVMRKLEALRELSPKERLAADAVIEKFNDAFAKEAQYRQENAGVVNVVRNLAKRIIQRAITLFRSSNTDNEDYDREITQLKQAVPSIETIMQKTQEVMGDSSTPKQGILSQGNKTVYYGNDLNELVKAVYGNDRSENILEVMRLIENGYYVPVVASNNGQGLMLKASSYVIPGIDMSKVKSNAETDILIGRINDAFMKQGLNKLKEAVLRAKDQQKKIDDEIAFYKAKYASQIKASISGARGLGETAAQVRVDLNSIKQVVPVVALQAEVKPAAPTTITPRQQQTKALVTPYKIATEESSGFVTFGQTKATQQRTVGQFAGLIGNVIYEHLKSQRIMREAVIQGYVDNTGAIYLGNTSTDASHVRLNIQYSPQNALKKMPVVTITILDVDKATPLVKDFIKATNEALQNLNIAKPEQITNKETAENGDIIVRVSRNNNPKVFTINNREFRIEVGAQGYEIKKWDDVKKKLVAASNPQTIWNGNKTVTFNINVQESANDRNVLEVSIRTVSGELKEDVVYALMMRGNISAATSTRNFAFLKEVRSLPGDPASIAVDKEDFTKGGIDLNAENFNLNIKRDGRGIVLPMPQQDLKMLNRINGFVPTILEIKPVVSLPIIAELEKDLKNAPLVASAS